MVSLFIFQARLPKVVPPARRTTFAFARSWILENELAVVEHLVREAGRLVAGFYATDVSVSYKGKRRPRDSR